MPEAATPDGSDPAVATTRAALHAVAEWLLAGPQEAATGTIRLRPLQGGFATTAGPLVRVSGTSLVTEAGSVPLRGTIAAVGAQAGLAPRLPSLYADHAPLGPDDPLDVDEDAARLLAAWFARGQSELRAFLPSATPVLWPEHFDLAIDHDETNYGVSPGDESEASPYAYVGPWGFDPTRAQGPFWNASFGALRRRREVMAPEALTRFFRLGREQAARWRRGPA
jgi:hypothetical protein